METTIESFTIEYGTKTVSSDYAVDVVITEYEEEE